MYCVIIAAGTGGMLSAVRQLSQLFKTGSEIDCRAAHGRGTYYTISCLSLPISFALLLVYIFVAYTYITHTTLHYTKRTKINNLTRKFILLLQYKSHLADLAVGLAIACYRYLFWGQVSVLKGRGYRRGLFFLFFREFFFFFFLLKYIQIYTIISSKSPLLVQFFRFYKLHWPKHL